MSSVGIVSSSATPSDPKPASNIPPSTRLAFSFPLLKNNVGIANEVRVNGSSWHSQMPFSAEERCCGVNVESYRGPPGAAAVMCAATPLFTALSGCSAGPEATAPQSGLLHRCPTRAARRHCQVEQSDQDLRRCVSRTLRSYVTHEADVIGDRAHFAQLDNAAENSHQPTRQRERAMKRFKSIRHAQRFLSAFSGISPHFRPRRHLLSPGRSTDRSWLTASRSGTRSPGRRPRPPPESATGTDRFVQATAHHPESSHRPIRLAQVDSALWMALSS